MTVEHYYKNIKGKSDEVFSKTLSLYSEKLAEAHHYISFFVEFSEQLNDIYEKDIILNFSSQFEFANLNLVNGLYRQAFTSMRLAFELGLASIYFSTNKLDLYQWKNGNFDIRWSMLSDKENGVISNKFFQAFFEDLVEHTDKTNEEARIIYRILSEFVHGNNHTWKAIDNSLEFSEELVNQYFLLLNRAFEILMLLMCTRYLKTNEINLSESLSLHIEENLRHIAPIREYIKGKVDKDYE